MEKAITILALLFINHLAFDFIFQPDTWVEDKNRRHFKSPKLYLHALLHGLIPVVILLSFGVFSWMMVFVIVVSHFLIDLGKSYFYHHAVGAFLFDQMLHLAIIVFVWGWKITGFGFLELGFHHLINVNSLLYLTAFVIAYWPTAIFINMATRKWQAQIKGDQDSLKDAGKWIGRLERLLILLFIFSNNVSGIGLLIAAKSVFRFGDLNAPEVRQKTEYILLGTLLSFTTTIFLGFFVEYLIRVI